MKKTFLLYLVTFVLISALLPLHGCTKKAVVQDTAPVIVQQAPKKAPVEEDRSEFARLGPLVSNEGAPQQGDVGRLGYFVVSTPNGDYIFYDIYFDFDKYTVREGDKEALKRHAQWFNENRRYVAMIEGHCDEVGTEEYNLALGERRASAVRQYLIQLGVRGDRIKTVSYGEAYPLDPASTQEAYAKNRRAHFVVTLEN
ncbi:MAG: peptidoglycan-associated lipoprotein Pal [Syntrophobacterales bacterium]|nr:peptidoglycan-associated lipoprotein Pal [Syntrophobacterales bacterium]